MLSNAQKINFRLVSGYNRCMSGIYLITIHVIIGYSLVDEEVTEQKRGIHWTFPTAQENIDFADDVNFLSQIKQQEKTDKPKEEGDKLGLKINHNKSMIMRTNDKSGNRIQLSNKKLKEIETFWFL